MPQFIELSSKCYVGQFFFFFPRQISVAPQNRVCEQQVQRLEIESRGLYGSGRCYGARVTTE